MESWILRISCKVKWSPLGFTYFARDRKYSWFHEHFKNWIHFLSFYKSSIMILWAFAHMISSYCSYYFQTGWSTFRSSLCGNQDSWSNSTSRSCQLWLWNQGNFVWFDSLRPINNLSVKQGRVFLGWIRTKRGQNQGKERLHLCFILRQGIES